MKSKRMKFLLILIVTLCFSPIFRVEANEVTNEDKKDTVLKSGDELILTESENANNEAPSIDPIEKPDDSNGEKDLGKNKDQDNSDNPKANTQKPLKATASSPPNKTKDTKEKRVNELIVEVNKFLEELNQKQKNPNETSKTEAGKDNNKEFEKAVEKATAILKSNDISKKESDKIAKETKEILKEYSKKIEQTSNKQKKQELAKEAAEKINKSVIKISDDLPKTSEKNKEKETIFDQKNQTLVVEIEATDTNIENALDGKNEENKEELTKSIYLGKSPKLNQKKSSKLYYIILVLVLALLLSISFAIYYALKAKDKTKQNIQ